MRMILYLPTLLISYILLSTGSWALPVSGNSLKLEFIQDQFELNNSNVKIAKILTNPDGSYLGLEIELKKSAVAEIEKMTNDGLGKKNEPRFI